MIFSEIVVQYDWTPTSINDLVPHLLRHEPSLDPDPSCLLQGADDHDHSVAVQRSTFTREPYTLAMSQRVSNDQASRSRRGWDISGVTRINRRRPGVTSEAPDPTRCRDLESPRCSPAHRSRLTSDARRRLSDASVVPSPNRCRPFPFQIYSSPGFPIVSCRSLTPLGHHNRCCRGENKSAQQFVERFKNVSRIVHDGELGSL